MAQAVFSLENRVALVTGGSRGIGKAISLHLAKAGARLAINYLSDDENAREAAAEIGELGCQVELYKGDITDAESAQRIVDEATATFGKIDILVNNAGKTADNLLVRMSEEEWDSVIHANLRGTFLMSRAVIRSMIRARYGRIINITSIDGLVGNAGQSNYSAAKAGVIGFTRSLSREVASRAITVNAVAPGVVKTRMTEVLNEKQWELLMNRIPMGRDGLAEEIAPVVTFLASDEASYLTGQVIAVDGGLT